MRTIATLDSETDPFKIGRVPRPFLWGLYNGANYWEFERTEDMVNFLFDKNWVVYAHNGGKFDYHFMLDFMCAYDEIKIISGRLAKFKIGLCEFRDSINIIPVPLSAYQKTKINYDIFEESERNKPENKKEISEYLKDDCVYLYDLVTSFVEEYGAHLTQATAAMKAWQKMAEIKPPRSTSLYYDLFKSFYYGGRVECIKKGVINEEFKIADINSAYPFAMLEAHPIGLDTVTIPVEEINSDHYEMVIGNYFYTVRCTARGCFPFRMSDGLAFPRDGVERVYTVTGWELLAATQTNTIDAGYTIIQIIHHLEYIDFEEYITHFYEKRKIAKAENDTAGSIFAKLLMNSLYGKFGANPRVYSNFYILPAAEVPFDN